MTVFRKIRHMNNFCNTTVASAAKIYPREKYPLYVYEYYVAYSPLLLMFALLFISYKLLIPETSANKFAMQGRSSVECSDAL